MIRSGGGVGVLTFLALVVAAVLAAVPDDASAATPRQNIASPSTSAKMICNREGQKDIAAALGGVRPSAVTTPRWSEQAYSCSYRYASGTVSLSVKELGTKAATVSYVSSLGRIAGRRADKLPLGQGAFWTTNGSVVVRKDTKVLFVDISRLNGAV